MTMGSKLEPVEEVCNSTGREEITASLKKINSTTNIAGLSMNSFLIKVL